MQLCLLLLLLHKASLLQLLLFFQLVSAETSFKRLGKEADKLPKEVPVTGRGLVRP